MWEIDVGRDLTSLAPVHAKIVPIHKNHIDVGIVHTPENHFDVGTVPILRSRVDVGTDHVHMGILIGVQIPRRSNDRTMLLWML